MRSFFLSFSLWKISYAKVGGIVQWIPIYLLPESQQQYALPFSLSTGYIFAELLKVSWKHHDISPVIFSHASYNHMEIFIIMTSLSHLVKISHNSIIPNIQAIFKFLQKVFQRLLKNSRSVVLSDIPPIDLSGYFLLCVSSTLTVISRGLIRFNELGFFDINRIFSPSKSILFLCFIKSR